MFRESRGHLVQNMTVAYFTDARHKTGMNAHLEIYKIHC